MEIEQENRNPREKGRRDSPATATHRRRCLTPYGKEKTSRRQRTSRHSTCLSRGVGPQGTVAQSARRRRAQPRASTRTGEWTGGGATIFFRAPWAATAASVRRKSKRKKGRSERIRPGVAGRSQRCTEQRARACAPAMVARWPPRMAQRHRRPGSDR